MMKKPTSQEVKRKIDSKIFELQSSLLEGGVTEALLRECAVWFRPSHLQDIVIERSEAEGKCGWPGCGDSLPSWGLSAPAVFDLSDGEEELGRFCCRACMSKTKIFFAAIPSTPPHSRQNLFRLACPEAFENLAASGRSGGGGGDGDAQKKVYKRPRRRDVPPTKPAIPENSAETKSSSSKSSSDPQRQPDLEGVSGAGQDLTACEIVGGGGGGGGGKVAVAEDGNIIDERVLLGVPPTPTPPSDGTVGGVATGTESVVGARTGGGDDGDKSGGGGGGDCGGGVEAVRKVLEKASISEKPRASSVEPQAFLPDTGTGAGGALAVAAICPSAPAAAAKGEAEPEAATSGAPAGGCGPAWENLRLNRPSGGAPSAVSLHATLAAAAAATIATAVPSSTGAAPTAAAAAAAPAASAATISASGSRAPGADQPAEGNGGGGGGGGGGGKTEVPARAGLRRKSVSFADGTKDSPPSAASAAGGAQGTTIGGGGGVGVGVGVGAGVGVPNPRGNRRGRGKGRGGRGGASSARVSILGGVVERAPAAPAPMEARVGFGGGGQAGRGAGLVEGHLPKIEADLSFRVLPRGSSVVDDGDGDGDLGDGTSFSVGEEVDEGPVGDDGVVGLGGGFGDEDGGEEEGEGEGEGEGGGVDAAENDRAIWRETFGEEMPAEVAQGSWIDMDTIRDKELREEFASSIAPFALLWSALSEWVTPDTRAVCRAGHAAAEAAAATAVTTTVTTTGTGGDGDGNTASTETQENEVIGVVAASQSKSPPNTESNAATAAGAAAAAAAMVSRAPFPSADFRVKRAGAVAGAVEAELRQRRAVRQRGGSAHDTGSDFQGGGGGGGGRAGGGGGGDGPTVTSALRHSGVSTMVNMHLAQAERALSVAGGGGVRGRKGGGDDNAGGARKKWRWSKTAPDERPGTRRGGWLEETARDSGAATATAAAATGEVVATETMTPPEEAKKREARGMTAVVGQRGGVVGDDGGLGGSGGGGGGNPIPLSEEKETLVPENGGGAECRRAVAAVIDTLDADSASAAANLSITQWKVVSLVLLTALGLGGGKGEGRGGGQVAAAAGVEACAWLCGPRASVVSAREFEMLVEVLLEEE